MQARHPRLYILRTTTGVSPTIRNNWIPLITVEMSPLLGSDRRERRGGDGRRGGAATARVVAMRERVDKLGDLRQFGACKGGDGMKDMVEAKGVSDESGGHDDESGVVWEREDDES